MDLVGSTHYQSWLCWWALPPVGSWSPDCERFAANPPPPSPRLRGDQPSKSGPWLRLVLPAEAYDGLTLAVLRTKNCGLRKPWGFPLPVVRSSRSAALCGTTPASPKQANTWQDPSVGSLETFDSLDSRPFGGQLETGGESFRQCSLLLCAASPPWPRCDAADIYATWLLIQYLRRARTVPIDHCSMRHEWSTAKEGTIGHTMSVASTAQCWLS